LTSAEVVLVEMITCFSMGLLITSVQCCWLYSDKSVFCGWRGTFSAY